MPSTAGICCSLCADRLHFSKYLANSFNEPNNRCKMDYPKPQQQQQRAFPVRQKSSVIERVSLHCFCLKMNWKWQEQGNVHVVHSRGQIHVYSAPTSSLFPSFRPSSSFFLFPLAPFCVINFSQAFWKSVYIIHTRPEEGPL